MVRRQVLSMRTIICALIISCTLAANGQQDTVQLKSGTLYTSIIRAVNNEKEIRLTDFRGRIYPLGKEFIQRVVLGDSIRSLTGWTVYVSKYSNAIEITDDVYSKPVDMHNELADIKDSRTYLRNAGAWGIAGTVLLLGGIITSAVAYPAGIPELAYAGAGVAGGGLILYIPAFANLMKSGKLSTP